MVVCGRVSCVVASTGWKGSPNPEKVTPHRITTPPNHTSHTSHTSLPHLFATPPSHTSLPTTPSLLPSSIGKCFYLSFVSARALLAIALVPPTHALSPAFANYQHDPKIVRSCLCRGTLASSSKYSLTSAPCLARFCPRPAHPRNLSCMCKLSA